jgi:hypothetical protein
MDTEWKKLAFMRGSNRLHSRFELFGEEEKIDPAVIRIPDNLTCSQNATLTTLSR